MRSLAFPAVGLAACVLMAGCAESSTPSRPAASRSERPAPEPPRPAVPQPAVPPADAPAADAPAAVPGEPLAAELPVQPVRVSEPPRTSLADLVSAEDTAPAAVPVPPRSDGSGAGLAINDTRAAAAGIRKLGGRHLTLYTDAPQSPEVDELPDVFDRAIPQWCRYFGVEASQLADWRITGFLMQQKERFQGSGLMPADLPPFPNGYQRGPYVWLYDQTTAYYRRHLLLHEGTHAFMDLVLGSQGPPWYGEGLAELLGTHRWETGTLTMSYLPSDKEQTPGWGRIKIVKDELAAGRGMLPAAILNYGPQAHRQNEPYGWCWAFAAFLDGHPAFRDRFRELHRHLRSGDVTGQFRRSFAADADDLGEQWQLFVMNLEYGYDLARAAIVRRPAVSLPPGGTTVTIEADRGWQSSGIRLAAGTEYRFAATGRYQLAETSAVWWCEPGGVTIHYYQGRPLGLLLAAVRDDSRPLDGMSPLLQPQTIGLETQWTPSRDGTLYLRINESPARLGDNQGQLTVRIEAASADRAISVNRRDR